MVTNNAKETACNAYKEYLQLIYYMGKGIMLATQIQRYMGYFYGTSKQGVWRHIRSLQEVEIIDVHKIQNNSYIKLKKYAVRFLLEKESSKNVASLSYSFTTLKKTTFKNEYVLQYLLKESLKDTINYCNKNTTLIAKNKKNWKVLKPYVKQNEVGTEIKNLIEIATQQAKILKSKKPEALKIQKVNRFNINNMQSRNIYIVEITENTVQVVVLDINNNYTAQKIKDTGSWIAEYFKMLMEDKRVLINICVATNSDVKRVVKEIKRASLINIEIGVINLNLKANCFSNVDILF